MNWAKTTRFCHLIQPFQRRRKGKPFCGGKKVRRELEFVNER